MVWTKGEINIEDKIYRIRVKSIWLFDGLIAAPLSIFSGILTLFTNKGPKSLTHWWVEIQTQYGWYCAQFQYRNGVQTLCLSRQPDEKSVDYEGQRATGSQNECKNKTIKFKSLCKNQELSIEDVIEFMDEYNGNYSLVSNNCQTFAKDLCNHLCKRNISSIVEQKQKQRNKKLLYQHPIPLETKF